MSNLANMFSTANVAIPDEGPKCIRVDYDFSTLASFDTEGLLATTTGYMSYVQGVFIDNRNNADTLTIKCQVTQQTIEVPPECQGYFPVLITNPPRFTISTTPAADLEVTIFYYNVPIQPGFWGPNGQSVSGDWLTDAELRAAPVPVSGPLTNVQLLAALPLAVTPTQPIGGAYTNRSIANLSGASEQLMAANANRRILIVSNEGATAIALNLTGGTAALNTAGNVTLAAGGSLTLDNYPPSGAINVIGTLNADITAYEG